MVGVTAHESDESGRAIIGCEIGLDRQLKVRMIRLLDRLADGREPGWILTEVLLQSREEVRRRLGRTLDGLLEEALE